MPSASSDYGLLFIVFVCYFSLLFLEVIRGRDNLLFGTLRRLAEIKLDFWVGR